MDRYRRFIFLMIFPAFFVWLAGCEDKNTDDHGDVPTIQRTRSGPYVAGTWESMVLSFPGSLDGFTLTWRVAIRPTTNTTWQFCDSIVSVASGLSFTFIVPDSTRVPFYIHVSCVAQNNSTMYSTTTEGTISGYEPVTHPMYLGTNSTCNQCHSAIVTAWNQTAHSRRLPITTTNLLSSCNQCHGSGYDTSTANGGSDEIFTGQMDGVQCEECHGPSETYGTSANAHTQTNGFGSGSTISSAYCQTCHGYSITPVSGHTWIRDNLLTHTGTFGLIHNIIDTSADADRCAGCHLASEAIKRLDGDSVSHWTSVIAVEGGIGCRVCHSVHPRNSDSYKMLRVNPDRLCQTCHEPNIDVPPSLDKQPLHPQADMLANNLSAIIPLSGANLPTTGAHNVVQGSCAVCHLYAAPWQAGIIPTGDHNFRVDYPACATCHTGIGSNFIVTSQDSIPDQLNRLTNIVMSMQSQHDTVTAHREAIWIAGFLNLDGSRGIHNKRLTQALLDAAFNRVGSSR